MDSIHNISNNLKSKAWISKLNLAKGIKRRLLKNVWVTRLAILVVVLAILALIVFLFIKLTSNTSLSYYSNLGRNFLLADTQKVKVVNGKINFVLLGKGGQGHEAPDLTDTIMFVSVDIQNKNVRIVSLPRDIWIPELRAKINSAYYWGNQKQENGGLVLAKSTIEQIVGEPVSYAIVLDFSGFKQIIDALGGIDVEVDEGFIDPLYPIAGKEGDLCGGKFVIINNERIYECRYEKIEFNKGLQHMDGETALKFVRSRHAEGDQGTDIARANRQQKVIDALKSKLTSKQTITSPSKLIAIFNAVKSVMETDFTDEQLSILVRFIAEARNNIKSAVIPEDLLTNPPISARYDYQYVFTPKTGNWMEVQNWIKEFNK